MSGYLQMMDGLSIGVELGGTTIMEIPGYMTHRGLVWQLPRERHTEQPFPLGINIGGRMRDIKIGYGMDIDPIQTTLYAGKTVITDFGGVVSPRMDPPNEDEPDRRYFFQLYRSGSFQMPAFEYFMGLWPDHPIVTGKDHAGCTHAGAIPMDAINLVQNYCSVNYIYDDEEPGRDHWKIMSETDTSGDCEDFAITKATMLLDMGYSIDHMWMESGYDEEKDPETGEVIWRIGHMWLIVDTSGGIKVMDCATICSRSFIRNEYPLDGMTQISGPVWRKRTGPWSDGGVEVTHFPQPGHQFHIKAVDVPDATIYRG